MTPEQRVQDALMASLPDIVESLKKEVKDSITWKVKSDLAKHVSETVTVWFKENMLEEIKSVLLEEKEGLISTIPEFSEKLSEELMKSMLDNMREKLSQSWERNKILEVLFK
jgi:hypothetical protein